MNQLSLFQEKLPLSDVLNGDCKEKLKALIEQGQLVDSIVTDPPYELGFMGKAARYEGFCSILIEKDLEYYKDILIRLHGQESGVN